MVMGNYYITKKTGIDNIEKSIYENINDYFNYLKVKLLDKNENINLNINIDISIDRFIFTFFNNE
jgi:hypothetical protein